MKKWILVSMVVSLVLVLTACGSAQSSGAVATASTGLSLEGQLLVGTIKLESTSLAVTSDQANQLLPLWETLSSLASSSTAATQEIDAVVSQIKDTMTAEQISGITAMDLTRQDLAAAVVDTSASAAASGSTSTTNANSIQLQVGAGPQGGGNPPSDMGGGMPASMGTQADIQVQTGTTQSVITPSATTAARISPALINALVEILKKKSA
jgi:hypothetical protein